MNLPLGSQLEPQAGPQNVDLEAEADDYENDLALGGESIASSTTLINSSIMKYREENGRTYHAYKKQLHRVLDIGIGTGIWAIDFANKYPETKIDDLEESWIFSEKFDFIYSRIMINSVADFPRLYQQYISFLILLNDSEFLENSAFKKYRSDLFIEGCEKLGRLVNSAKLYKSQLKAASFVDVPKDRKLEELGMWQLENITSGLESFNMAMFTRVLG
ncbi:hypothetical protein BKA61DRAFT_635159 [Leptodontidium sp. MPI-SDFR-AT-0119]|nr:hypothetical protein BKA61DRAFT_635159 [Leptodontidium sp. MPI-SDFR-AT-0119]